MIQEERAHGMRVNAFSLEGENSIGTKPNHKISGKKLLKRHFIELSNDELFYF